MCVYTHAHTCIYKWGAHAQDMDRAETCPTGSGSLSRGPWQQQRKTGAWRPQLTRLPAEGLATVTATKAPGVWRVWDEVKPSDTHAGLEGR